MRVGAAAAGLPRSPPESESGVRDELTLSYAHAHTQTFTNKRARTETDLLHTHTHTLKYTQPTHTKTHLYLHGQTHTQTHTHTHLGALPGRGSKQSAVKRTSCFRHGWCLTSFSLRFSLVACLLRAKSGRRIPSGA